MTAFLPMPDGCRLAYRVQGRPGAPWLVLLNGLLSDMTMWAGALPGLRDHFRILAFDSRGQGQSDAPDLPYTVGLRTDDAAFLLEALGIQRPWLVGLSNGSAVGLDLLSRAPEAYAGAVLVSAAPGVDFAMRLKLQHWLDCLEKGGPLMQFDAVAPYLWGDRFLEKRHAVLRAYHEATLGAGHGGDRSLGARNQVRGALASTLPDLGSIRDLPLLLLSGAEDLLTPPWKSRRLAEQLPGSCFEVVEWVGHAYPVENPKGFSQRCVDFVQQSKRNADSPG